MGEPARGPRAGRRWLARLSFVLAAAAVAVLVIFADLHSITMLAVGLVTAAVTLAAAFWFLSMRGIRRLLAGTLAVLAPLTALALYTLSGLLWVACASIAVWALAGVAARGALASDPATARMPESEPDSPARRPFLIMNPRSGGGKVVRFGLAERARELGATVFLMDGPDQVDVAAVARQAVADGADLLGVAGGDGTQALVAEVAADHGLPFVVIAAGTRNHFALDLGLDRDDPARGLDALTDGVELRVDLGQAGDRIFVNNASFGAYAEIVQSPDYRGRKLGSSLDALPDLLTDTSATTLEVTAPDVRITAPQAVLIGNNPYGNGGLGGLGRRARLDRGVLGVVVVTMATAWAATSLLTGRRSASVTVLAEPEVSISAEAAAVPVGLDGEATMLATPVRCAIRPAALRVRVPRHRPGVVLPPAATDWARLSRLAGLGRPRHNRSSHSRSSHSHSNHGHPNHSGPASRPGEPGSASPAVHPGGSAPSDPAAPRPDRHAAPR